MAERPTVHIELDAPGIAVGWVHVEGCTNGPSPLGLLAEARSAVERALSSKDSADSVARKAAVRDMLRFGTYKPTGRGKPASEYLLNAALEGRFPAINALVDVNNLVSLETLLPISVVDLDLAATTSFTVRRGREGESYVFNPSGQVLDLRDLLLAARLPTDLPCASPIKDCQATKTQASTLRALGLVYAPRSLASEALWAAERMAELARRHLGATAEAGLRD